MEAPHTVSVFFKCQVPKQHFKIKSVTMFFLTASQCDLLLVQLHLLAKFTMNDANLDHRSIDHRA